MTMFRHFVYDGSYQVLVGVIRCLSCYIHCVS